jgi:hypothetical protein
MYAINLDMKIVLLLLRPFSDDNFNRRSSQLCNLLFGGVKSTQSAVL